MLFMIFNTIYSTITSLPFSLYSTFVIEERHGFNKQVNSMILLHIFNSFLFHLFPNVIAPGCQRDIYI